MTEMNFVNGVRLLPANEKPIISNKEKYEQAIQYISKIAPKLGGAWMIQEYVEHSIHLVLNGGYMFPGGATLCFINRVNDARDKGRPDYWKFTVVGRYPQPTKGNERFNDGDEPRLGVRIDNPTKAAAAITEIIQSVLLMTEKAQAFCVSVVAKCEEFDRQREEMENFTNDYLTDNEWSNSRCMFRTQVGLAFDKAQITMDKGSQFVELNVRLTEFETREVIAFIRSMRPPSPEEKPIADDTPDVTEALQERAGVAPLAAPGTEPLSVAYINDAWRIALVSTADIDKDGELEIVVKWYLPRTRKHRMIVNRYARSVSKESE